MSPATTISGTAPAVSPLRRLRSAVGQVGREVGLYHRALAPRGAPRVIVYPSSTREQSSLLRGYNIADGLGRDLGWATLVVPRHLAQSQRERVARMFRPDVAIVQKCRHPLNRAEFFRPGTFLLDVDDADFHDPALSEPMARMAERSAGVICGSRYIRDWAAPLAPWARIVWTGTPIDAGPWSDHADRARIVTWAHAEPLRYERDMAFVTDILVRVAARTAPFTLRLHGWSEAADHPALAPFRDACIALDLKPPLPYDAFLASHRCATSPSVCRRSSASPVSAEGSPSGRSSAISTRRFRSCAATARTTASSSKLEPAS